MCPSRWGRSRASCRSARTCGAHFMSSRSSWPTPELARGQCRALHQGVQFRPGDLRVDAAAEAAVSGRDDVLPPDRLGVPGDPVRDDFRVLDDVGGVADHAGQDDLALGQLHVPPHFPLVLVPDVGRLERVGARVDLQHDVNDVGHRDVGSVRAVPAAPAQVEADPLGGQATDRVVKRFDPLPGEAPVVLHARCRVDLVPVLGDRRVVELQHKARLDDRGVLLAHRLRAGVHHLLVVGVVLVAEAGATARRHRVEEAVGDARGRHRGLHVGDVALHVLLSLVGDRAAADRRDRRPVGQGRARGRVLVRVGERQPVPALAEGGEPDLAWLGRRLRYLGDRKLGQLDVGQPLEHVGPPGAVIVALTHRMPVLAVIDKVDAGRALARDHVRHRRAQPAQVLRLFGEVPRRAQLVERDQVLWSRQAARVAGQDPVRHISSLRFIRR